MSTSDPSRPPGGGLRLVLLIGLVLVAFAANSVLCRKALAQTALDPASFTLIRLGSGALVLFALTRLQTPRLPVAGSWRAALALLGYAVCFSFAYLTLSSGTGALLLFGAVQTTMIVKGLLAGERLNPWQWLGLLLALGGVAGLVAPGITAPDPLGAALMLAAGVAWGAYSLLGRSSTSGPVQATAGNFLRATPVAAAIALLMVLLGHANWDGAGIGYGVASGAVASGLGYALWYKVLPALRAATAASLQLSVPVITVMGGTLVLGEDISLRLVLASVAVLGGIALVVRAKRA